MPAWAVLSGVTWTTLPADPLRVIACVAPSSMAMRRQIRSVVRRSASRMRGKRERAEQDMGADPWLEAVEAGPELQGGLHVTEPRSASRACQTVCGRGVADETAVTMSHAGEEHRNERTDATLQRPAEVSGSLSDAGVQALASSEGPVSAESLARAL